MNCNSSGCCPEPIYPGCPDATHPTTVFPYGPIYDATLDLHFPNKWEFGWLTNTVVLAHDTGLTWISDEFTYNGETCVATLVITGVGSREATLTIETNSVYLGDVVYVNEWLFENLGPNRMVVDGTTDWTPANGAHIGCLYPYEAVYECPRCLNADITGFVIESSFGTNVYIIDDMYLYADRPTPTCNGIGTDEYVVWDNRFLSPCFYFKTWCVAGERTQEQTARLSGGPSENGFPWELWVREITYDEFGQPNTTVLYRLYGPDDTPQVDCHDDSTIHTLTAYSGGSGTITWRFLRV